MAYKIQLIDLNDLRQKVINLCGNIILVGEFLKKGDKNLRSSFTTAWTTTVLKVTLLVALCAHQVSV